MAEGVGAVSVAEDALRLKAGQAVHHVAEVGIAEGQALQGSSETDNDIGPQLCSGCMHMTDEVCMLAAA